MREQGGEKGEKKKKTQEKEKKKKTKHCRKILLPPDLRKTAGLIHSLW